jgi:tetratricopeptide (TPR) repeat protein
VLQGRAFEMGSQVPYQVAVDALRSSSLHPLTSNLQPVWLSELARLLPELYDLIPNLPPPLRLDEAESRSRLFEAVTRLGQAQASGGPLVLLIDDLHWADGASLDLLGYAARRWATARLPVMLLVAVRSEELPAVDDWLTALGREIALTRLTLPPLTQEDTVILAKALEIGELENALVSNLYSQTGGHPLFVIETLKSLREHSGAIPPGVRDVIRQRLNRLSEKARLACSAAAVLGGQIEFGPLCRVIELSEDEGLPALEELLARGLLRETRRDVPVERLGVLRPGDAAASGEAEAPSLTPGRLYFAHDKIREVAYAELSDARRQVFHKRALGALETASPGELARHALAAGLPDQAFHLLIQAGDEAMRVFAARTAILHYEQARDLIGALGESPVQLHLQLGRAYELISDWGAARKAYEAALALARESGQADAESIALNALALVVAKSAFDIPTAAGLLREAQRAAERSGDKTVLAETEMNLAQTAMYQANPEAILAHAERALALGRELGRDDIVARSLNVKGYAGVVGARWEIIIPAMEESSALYARLGHRLMQSDSLAVLGACHAKSGSIRQGRDLARQAYAMGVELENDWGQANSAFHYAQTLLDSGEYTQALAVAGNGVARARLSGHPPLLVFNLYVLGNIYRALFALDPAREAHQEAWMIAQLTQHPLPMQWAAAGLCADESAAGNWAEALTYAQHGLAIREAFPPPQTYARLLQWHDTEALVRGGETERAAQDVERMRPMAEGWVRYRVPYLRSLAVLAHFGGETAQAAAHLTEAASLAESIGLPGELWPLYAMLDEKQRAAEIVQSLAAGINDERLRQNFVAEATRQIS